MWWPSSNRKGRVSSTLNFSLYTASSRICVWFFCVFLLLTGIWHFFAEPLYFFHACPWLLVEAFQCKMLGDFFCQINPWSQPSWCWHHCMPLLLLLLLLLLLFSLKSSWTSKLVQFSNEAILLGYSFSFFFFKILISDSNFSWVPFGPLWLMFLDCELL